MLSLSLPSASRIRGLPPGNSAASFQQRCTMGSWSGLNETTTASSEVDQTPPCYVLCLPRAWVSTEECPSYLSGLVRDPNQITYLTHTRHNGRCSKTGNSYCRHLVTSPQVGNISKKQWKGTCCMQRVGRILPQASFAFPNIVKAGPPVSFCSLR